ncbi:MAG: hypothetical protein V5A62_08975 [Haloarculaceae archaeon]
MLERGGVGFDYCPACHGNTYSGERKEAGAFGRGGIIIRLSRWYPRFPTAYLNETVRNHVCPIRV